MKSESARPIEAKKHRWYTYNGKKPLTISQKKGGGTLTLKKGDLFGVQNINNRTDRVVTRTRPDIRFLLPVEETGELLDLSKRYKEPVEFAVIEKKPKPVKAIKPPKITTVNMDRLNTIKKAATKPQEAVKAPKKITITSKKRDAFDLDEDTFTEDYASIDFHDFM